MHKNAQKNEPNGYVKWTIKDQKWTINESKIDKKKYKISTKNGPKGPKWTNKRLKMDLK